VKRAQWSVLVTLVGIGLVAHYATTHGLIGVSIGTAMAVVGSLLAREPSQQSRPDHNGLRTAVPGSD
jgi:hypothetical protein